MSLSRKDILENLCSDSIEVDLCAKTDTISYPSYIVDISPISTALLNSVSSLEFFLNENGDTSLYIKKDETMTYIGKANSSMVYRLLRKYVQSTFGNEAIIYECLSEKEKNILNDQSINALSLNL